MALLLVLMFVPGVAVAWVYFAHVDDPNRPPPWKHPAVWLISAGFLFAWLLWFGAFWSIADRLRGVANPLPWPATHIERPDWVSPEDNWTPLDIGPPLPKGVRADNRVYRSRSSVVVRVRPGAVYYHYANHDRGEGLPAIWHAITRSHSRDWLVWEGSRSANSSP